MFFSHVSEFDDWFSERQRANTYRVRRVPLEEVTGWSTDPDTGNIRHHSGKFFTVEGLEVTAARRETESWEQPIIVQPERGILGILVKEFDGVLHCLLQAKMEPGNVNLVQLSPTVQATRSNYTRVHGGKAVPYLDYFTAPQAGSVVFDALQSEQGAWFLAKRNRNMIVRTRDDVEVLEDFCWLSLEQVAELLQVDNLVNMDTRTVLSGAIPLRGRISPGTAGDGLYTTAQLLSWFTEAKARSTLKQRLIPLSKVSGWTRTAGEIVHDGGRHFAVIGVEVEASNREVSGWAQPMFAPRGKGVIAFLTRRIRDTMHYLVQARAEAGVFDDVEIGPTVQCQPDNYRHLPVDRRPRFLEHVLGASPAQVRFDRLHSEEGGRFYQAQSNYMLVEVGEDFPIEVPENYTWMTLNQLVELVRYGNYLNVEARNLLSCLGFSGEQRKAHADQELCL